MDRPVVNVPLSLMRQASVEWDIDWRGQSAGERTDGSSGVIHNEFPRWVGAPSLKLRAELMARWRAIRWQAQGRVGLYRVPMLDPAIFRPGMTAPSPDWVGDGVPFAAGQRYSVGSGFDYVPWVAAAAAATACDTSVIVSVPDAQHLPRVGQILSHDDFPFGVAGVISLGGGDYQLEVARLWSNIAVGDQISLIGTGLFELVSGDTGRPVYGNEMVATFSVQWQEVLAR
jgi:hypothetical protein